MDKMELPADAAKKGGDVMPGGGGVDEKSSEDTSQHITGVELYVVTAGLTVVAFLMMLDSTIVATVG